MDLDSQRGPVPGGQPGCAPGSAQRCSAQPGSAPCSPQASLCHRGVPGQVLALHAHWGGRAHLRNGGQAAGGCVLGNQDTPGAGKAWAAHLSALPAVGGTGEAFVPCCLCRNQNLLPTVEQGSKVVVEIWIMLFPVHWLFES